MAGLSGEFNVRKNFALSAVVQFHSLPVDAASQGRHIMETNPLITEVRIKSGNYFSYNALLGPRVYFPVTSKISLTGRLYAGWMVLQTPENHVWAGRIVAVEHSSSEAVASGFTWQAGVGALSSLNERLSLGLSVDYASSSLTFNQKADTQINLPDTQVDFDFMTTPLEGKVAYDINIVIISLTCRYKL
jgi:hypothetical protein